MLGQHPQGWVHWELPRRSHVYLADFEEWVRRIGEEVNEPVLALHVETSDYGYIVALHGAEVAARAVVMAESAPDFREGIWALRTVTEYAGEGWRDAAMRGLVSWAKVAPRQISTEEARGILRDDWIAPEDAVHELRRLLGLELPYPTLR